MAARLPSIGAVLFLLLGTVLLANPLYLHSSADRGTVFVDVERTSPADGAASLSASVTYTDDVPPVARYAARHAIENGSFAVDRDAPPLALRLFERDWRYLGSQRRTAVYRPSVVIEEDQTTLRLQNVSIGVVEAELGLPPPGRLNETDHPKEIAWLAHESESVVAVGDFEEIWEMRFEDAIENGQLTVPNENHAETFAPLGDDVRFVAHDGHLYRITLEDGAHVVTLRLSPADNGTVLSEVGIDVVSTDELPSDTQRVLTRALSSEDGVTRVSREEVNVTRLDEFEGRLLRHQGRYYVVRRGHVDDFDLTPLVRLVFTGVGIVAVAIGASLGWWVSRD